MSFQVVNWTVRVTGVVPWLWKLAEDSVSECASEVSIPLLERKISVSLLYFGEKLCTFLLISSSSTFFKILVLSLILLRYLPANLSHPRCCRSTVRLSTPCLISRIT